MSLLVGRPEPLDEHLVAGLDVRMKDVRIGDAESDAADGLHVASEQLDEVDDRLVAVAARREAVQLVSDEAPPRAGTCPCAR